MFDFVLNTPHSTFFFFHFNQADQKTKLKICLDLTVRQKFCGKKSKPMKKC